MKNAGVDDFLVLVLLVNAIVVFVFATVLLFSLPRRVKIVLQKSKRLFDCWVGLLVVMVLTTLPTNVVVLFVHFELIPWPLATQALQAATIRGDGTVDVRDHLIDIQDKHQDWFVEHGGTADSAHEVQRMLWESWPLIVFGSIALALVSIWILGKFYTQLVLYLINKSLPP